MKYLLAFCVLCACVIVWDLGHWQLSITYRVIWSSASNGHQLQLDIFNQQKCWLVHLKRLQIYAIIQWVHWGFHWQITKIQVLFKFRKSLLFPNRDLFSVRNWISLFWFLSSCQRILAFSHDPTNVWQLLWHFVIDQLYRFYGTFFLYLYFMWVENISCVCVVQNMEDLLEQIPIHKPR